MADVGCDHGKIGMSLLQSGRAERVLFCDISAPSLAKARQLATERGYLDRSEFICRDGLGEIRCDAAVIAGMGGAEILDILKGAEELPRYLVLQPMKDERRVREELKDKYRFVEDRLFYDGDKYYNLMYLERGRDSFSEEESEYGRDNLKQPTEDFIRYLSFRLKTYDEVLSVKDVASVRLRKESVEALIERLVLIKESPE